MNKIIYILIISLTICVFSQEVKNDEIKNNEVKNVIMLIPDGTSIGGITLARWYKIEKIKQALIKENKTDEEIREAIAKEGKLALDEIVAGLVRVYCSDSAITDSAPAATAFATGFKSQSKFIGVLPKKVSMPGLKPVDKLKPVATVLEAAKLSGKSTGLIATSHIQHATPAGFSSHTPRRDDYETIGEQQVYNGIDVVLGGGYHFLQKREDKENLAKDLVSMGYEYFTDPKTMMESTSDKIWGMFAPEALRYDFDRNPEN